MAPRASPGWSVRATGPARLRLSLRTKQNSAVASGGGGGFRPATRRAPPPLAPSLAPRVGGGAPLRPASAVGGRGKSPRVQTIAPPRPDTATKSRPGNETAEGKGSEKSATGSDASNPEKAEKTQSPSVEEAPRCSISIDRGLGLRRALSDETQSRPFQPLGGEVLHIGWLRTSEDGKVSRAEGESDRDCLELLLKHYTVDSERQEEILDRVVRGWSDVTLTLGDGYYCRLQRFSEFDTLTLSGPGNPEEPLSRAVRPWQWMLPEGWLATVPGKVFLCAHVVVRNTDTEDSLLVDENDLWNELQMVSNAVGWERRDRGYAEGETSRSAARDEALTAIAEMVTSDEEDMPAVLEWDSGSGSYDPDPGSLTEEERANLTWFQLAERQAEIGKNKSASEAVPVSVRGQGTGRRSMLPIIVTEQCIEEGGTVDECIEEAFTEEEVLPPELKPKKQKRNGESHGHRAEKKPEKRVRKYAGFGTDRWQRQQRDKRKKEARRHQMEEISETVDGAIGGPRIDPSTVPAQWQRWGSQLESSRIVAFAAGGGVRFYANYHLDNEGGMSCVLLAPRGASVVRAARQLQRFFTIEQYRLIILQRLPGAKSMYPRLSKLEHQYETLSQSIRRMNEGSGPKGGVVQRIGRQWRGDRRRQTQEFLEKITELEQATAQELARAKSEAATSRAYSDIIATRFEEADYKPLGGEVRFLPPFVRKRLDPAVSTIFSVAERAQILSDALERTNALLQATVNVRLQLNYERLSLYALIFTVISVFATLVTSVTTPGPMQDIFHWLMARVVRPVMKPIAMATAKLAGL